jgi:hypothetical protein
MAGAQGIQAAGSGFRAAVYAWLEEISFRAGLITASIAFVVLAALATAGVLVAGLGQGTQHADASPAITSHAAATASAPPASAASTPRPVPSSTQQASTQQATQSPVTADTTAPQAAATPQATAYSPAAVQDPASQGHGSQGHGSRTAGSYSRWQQPGSLGPGFGRQGGAMRLGGFIGFRRLPG